MAAVALFMVGRLAKFNDIFTSTVPTINNFSSHALRINCLTLFVQLKIQNNILFLYTTRICRLARRFGCPGFRGTCTCRVPATSSFCRLSQSFSCSSLRMRLWVARTKSFGPSSPCYGFGPIGYVHLVFCLHCGYDFGVHPLTAPAEMPRTKWCMVKMKRMIRGMDAIA